MRPNPVRERWRAGLYVLNGWVSFPDGYYAEHVGHQGWDSVTVDMQHAPIDVSGVTECLIALSSTPAVPIVRVPSLEEGMLMKVLDAGAYGVICPLINTRAQAETLVAATSYPPMGHRSHGPMRGLLYGGSDYVKHANDTVVRFAMIETAEALANLDEIASTPGLDGLYVGPTDLSMSMGFMPSQDPTEPDVVRAIEAIVGAARRHDIKAGFHAGSPAYAKRVIKLGYSLVSISTDVRTINAAAQGIVREMRN